MSERTPIDIDQFAADFKRSGEAGLELMKQDAQDAERGPIVRKVRSLMHAFVEKGMGDGSAYSDFSTHQQAFMQHFGEDARKYRLFHLICGSTPHGDAVLFDADGEWSLSHAIDTIADRHNIQVGE